MKLSRPLIKRAWVHDHEWDDDPLPYYETGTAYDLSENTPAKPLSMSRAADAAIHWQPKPKVGF